jgi:hypothetical protein
MAANGVELAQPILGDLAFAEARPVGFEGFREWNGFSLDGLDVIAEGWNWLIRWMTRVTRLAHESPADIGGKAVIGLGSAGR